ATSSKAAAKADARHSSLVVASTPECDKTIKASSIVVWSSIKRLISSTVVSIGDKNSMFSTLFGCVLVAVSGVVTPTTPKLYPWLAMFVDGKNTNSWLSAYTVFADKTV